MIEALDSIETSIAERWHYAKWLQGYLDNGGSITHRYDYPFERVCDQFLIVMSNGRIPKLCGSDSRFFIIPCSVICDWDSSGHSTIAFMDKFRLEGIEYIPVFKDMDEYLR